jgi:hypothetical protein
MNRCIKTFLLSLWLVSGLASAQTVIREAPKDVRSGRLVVTAPPVITLDGKPERLSPGSRIRDTNNMLLLSGSVVGQSLPVLYRREPSGLVHEVWVLTPDEYARLGGADGSGGAEGYKRFAELLNLIFGARK